MTMSLIKIKQLIKDDCGLTFTESREATLIESLKIRMGSAGSASEEEYLDLIGREKAELQELINLVTVNETYFFREPRHLEILVEKLVPPAFSRLGPGEKLKIVSAGCSTGEEP